MVVAAVLLGLLSACREPNSVAPATTQPAANSAQPPANSSQPPVPTGGAELLVNPLVSQLCNIEFMDGQSFGASASPTSGRFVVRGWLGDASGIRPASPMLVLSREGSDVKTLLPISLDTSRPDVEAYYSGKKGLANSGFETTVDVSSQDPGDFHMYLAYAIDGQGYVCDNGRRVQLLKH